LRQEGKLPLEKCEFCRYSRGGHHAAGRAVWQFMLSNMVHRTDTVFPSFDGSTFRDKLMKAAACRGKRDMRCAIGREAACTRRLGRAAAEPLAPAKFTSQSLLFAAS
jgi:hypothetical protein